MVDCYQCQLAAKGPQRGAPAAVATAPGEGVEQGSRDQHGMAPAATHVRNRGERASENRREKLGWNGRGYARHVAQEKEGAGGVCGK